VHGDGEKKGIYIGLECKRVAGSTNQYEAGRGGLAASDTSGWKGA
jgi:hypothetical protein